MGTALLRTLPSSYAAGATRVYYEPGSGIDMQRARRQHELLAEALDALGDHVVWLDSPDDQPDAVFVEDTAVIVGDRALIARSAHPGRAAEAEAVADALDAMGLTVVRMQAGTLDGGDVLRIGGRLWVGRSDRTDADGVAALQGAFPELAVQQVKLPPGVLHLKCVASTPGDGQTVVLAEGTVPPDVFDGVRVVLVPHDEAYAANVVGNGDEVLVPAGYPGAAAALRRAGFTPRAVEVSELRKGDGSLTCVSLRW